MIRKFDTDITKALNKLIKLAKEKLPETRAYFVNVTLWDDTDFRIELISNWAGKQDKFVYNKSSNKFEYHFGNVEKGIFIREKVEEMKDE